MTDQPAKSPRWMRLVLIASLAANLLIVGLLVGAAFRDKHDHRGPARGGDERSMPGDLRGLARAMPQAPRDALRAAIESTPDAARERRRLIRENRQKFLAALEAEPFSIEDIEAIFNDQHGLFMAIARDGQGALLEAIKTMTADERSRFVANLRKGPRGPRKN